MFLHDCSGPAAFTNQLLLDIRWLVGGMSRDPNSKKSHIWTELLRVTPEKQCVFVQRVLFLHDLASRRGARSASSRLNIQEWGIECERMIFLSSMVLHMSVVTDDHGGRIFSDEVVRSIVLRCVEGWLGTFNLFFL